MQLVIPPTACLPCGAILIVVACGISVCCSKATMCIQKLDYELSLGV